jgi:hypothetical protein
MNNWSRFALAIVSASALSAAACSGSPSTDVPGSGDGGASSNPPPLGGTQACAERHQGCLCDAPGSTGACWTGPATSRGTGSCKDGVATCVQTGEFLEWGACVGQVLECGPGSGGGGYEDGGGPGNGGGGYEDGGGPGSGGGGHEDGATCTGVCVPGSEEWCDEPLYCAWGKQQCTPQGTWGPCKEVTQPPVGCGGPSYDPFCCAQHGQCCQIGNQSIGNCGGIVCNPHP